MRAGRRALIIPVEEQSRELDAKLLLGCIAAERGFPVILGSRHEIHLRAARLPRGIVYAKSFRPVSRRMFDIFTGLGHEIVACDEEALRPYPDEIYFERRMSPRTLAAISQLFAWGAENAALFQRYPHYDGTPIHVTGNPRADLLRPELRDFYREEVDQLRARYGDFVLINTNFAAVNHRVDDLLLANQPPPAGPDDYLDEIRVHKLALFEHFRAAIPALAQALPAASIVVRPHPLERHAAWRDAARGEANVHVVHDGNVVPWLMAARAVVQNNCTTALEGYAVGCPVVSYRPARSARFDDELCAALSHCCADPAALRDTLRAILDGGAPPREPEQRKAMRDHISGLEGSLASERIVDVLEHIEASGQRPRPGRAEALGARCHAELRALDKRLRSLRRSNKNHRSYQEHRFPPLAASDVQQRIERLAATTGRFRDLRARRLARDSFAIGGADR
jgi:surface carbohydrate biosynthesis protein